MPVIRAIAVALFSLAPPLASQQPDSGVVRITVEESVNGYLLDIVGATRKHSELRLGVSTRGALTLYRAAQSLALVEDRDYVIPDDVKRLAVPILAHRIEFRGLIREGQRERAKNVIGQILDRTPVPK